ncbi:class I SAM-dependent methyltransferase [Arthrobacter sp. USHLN218]|uniref:class I SAM-dependent methyltransferase n=1 Tax=Arthrobacter sp. USHLN218 TaxID=3081232 RepID=UPI0030163F59
MTTQHHHDSGHRQGHTHDRHGHGHGHGNDHSHEDHGGKAGVAELLELEAAALGPYSDEIADWAAGLAAAAPRTIVDLGAGTGAGSIALARRFPSAEVAAVDNSPHMLGRLSEAADRHGLGGRIHPLQADLDEDWPDIREAGLIWAASSLHEVAEPDRILADAFSALASNGLLVAIEMDTLPRFLPRDVGLGEPGLELRCHEALARAGWNAHPDWREPLERAGFRVAAQRSFTPEARPGEAAGRYAHAFLTRIRRALDGELSAADRRTLDHLLDAGNPDALANRGDLAVRVSRTAWAARRP